MKQYWLAFWAWFTGVAREGSHSTKQASSYNVWDIFLGMPASDTGYIPVATPPGKHRPERIERVGYSHRLKLTTLFNLCPPSRYDWGTMPL